MWQMRIVEADRCWTSGDLAGAETILREVIAEGGPDGGPHATCLLGELLADGGDLAGARSMYQQAIDSGHPIHSQRAALLLGALLLDEDLTTVYPLFRLAADGADPDLAGRAQALLAHTCYLLGDLAGAHAARQQTLANKDPFVVAMANTVDLPPLEDG